MSWIQMMMQSLIVINLCGIEAFGRNRKDKEHISNKKDIVNTFNVKLQKDANLCTMEGNSEALHCVCIGGSPPYNTTSAECWVFTTITKDHRIWALFATQPHIVELKLMVRQQGHFNFIPTKGLRHLNHLKVLIIKYANINEIHPYAFGNSSTLYELVLSRNQIVNLDHHAFAHLTSLTELYLDENRIAEIRRDAFVDLPKLQKLFAAHNNLSVIQEGAFRHLAHLLELELDTNYISVLTRDTFTGLGELKRLDLGYNKISMLGDLTFSELWVLEDLNLENNQIELISSRAFAGLNHLKRLTLNHNRLVHLSVGLLSSMPAITYLDLRSNNMETLTFESIQPIYNNLKDETSDFYISDNKFVCDCRLAWLHRLRNETKNAVVRNILDEIKCLIKQSGQEEGNEKHSANNQFPEIGADYKYDKNEYENSDEDDYDTGEDLLNQQKDTLHNYITEITPSNRNKKIKIMRYLFEIPLQKLPCPQQDHPTEASRIYNRTPGYEGINANCGIISNFTILPIFLIILLILFK